jgi:hypothetical protein
MSFSASVISQTEVEYLTLSIERLNTQILGGMIGARYSLNFPENFGWMLNPYGLGTVRKRKIKGLIDYE